MIKQVYPSQLPVVSQNQFINNPSNNNQAAKLLQKNFSTSTLHKAPLPPKLFKATKNSLLETATSNPVGLNYNENYLQNQGKFENNDTQQEIYKQQYNLNDWKQQNQRQYYDTENDGRKYSVDINDSKRHSQQNSNLDTKALPNLFSTAQNGMQILPISMQMKNNNQQNEGLSQMSLNMQNQNSQFNNSLLNQIDQSQQTNSIKDSKTINNNIINSNNGQQQIQLNKLSNTYQQPISQSSNIYSKPPQQEERTLRSNSENLMNETRNSSDLKQFQIYLNKVTIDPNEQFMLKTNKNNEVQSRNEKQDLVNKFDQEKKHSIQLDLQNVFITEGGDSPFTLNNKRAHSLPAKPLILQKSSSNQQFSSFIPISIEKKNVEIGKNNEILNSDEQMRIPIRKTSTFAEKTLDENYVTIVQVEDYGSIQSIKNQQDRSNHFNSNQGFFGRETRISSIDKYDSNNQQDSMLAILNQNYNNNGQQNQNQNIMILNSLNSNMTGPDQSPTLSAITKQSELVRRKTSVDEYQRFISSQNTQNIQSILINNNPSKQIQFDSNEFYKQHRSSIIQPPHKQSDGMEEINEEQYSESIVLDKTNSQFNNNNNSNSYGSRKDLNNIVNNSFGSKKETKMSQFNTNISYQDKIKPNAQLNLINTPFQAQKITSESEKSYYLQKADQFILQFKQTQAQLNNNNSNQIDPLKQNPQNEQIQNNNQMQNNYPIPSINFKVTEKSTEKEKISQIYYDIQQQQNPTNILKSKNQIITDQTSINKFQQVFQLPFNSITDSNQPINTERRKKNIDQIVQKCVERTEDLLEKLKTKKQKIKEAKSKNQINTDRETKLNIEFKNKHSEEIRQSKQKVDEMFNEALNRSRQVVQRHAQNKIQQNSPPVFYKNVKTPQQGFQFKQEVKDQNLLNNFSPQQRIHTDNSVYNRNQDSDGSNNGINQEYNTFGYYSNGAQNRYSVTSNFNQQMCNKQNSIEPKIGDYQSRISPVGSKERYHDHNTQTNSWSKANNSISFDIQAGNSGKTNNMMSQETLSPNLKKIEPFGSSDKQIATSESERIQFLNSKGIDLQNGMIFDGVIDVNGWKQGYGILKNKVDYSLIYEGEWKNNSFHGSGILYNQNPNELIGHFNYKDFNGLQNYWKVYEGEFEMGKRTGSGTLILTNNEKYSGKFQFDNISGEGVFYRNDISQQPIVGQWFNNILIKIL